MRRIVESIRCIAFILTLVVSVLSFQIHGAEIIHQGTCGENLSWTYDSDGVLTISGTGDMTDFSPYSDGVGVPWSNYRAYAHTIIIESGVTSIGDEAFAAFSNLTHISLPDTLSSIGNRAFYNCRSLPSIVLPESVTVLGEYAFAGCVLLEQIALPAGITRLENYAFEGCTGLQTISLPSSLGSIGKNAFNDCISLTAITIPEGVTKIDRNAFVDCTGLQSISLPQSLAVIGAYAFDGCTSLGHFLYSGSEAQWKDIDCRSGAFADTIVITYNYAENIPYHAFDNACDPTCNLCSFTRETTHEWDAGIANEDTTITFTCTVCGEVRSEGTPVAPTIPVAPTSPSISTDPTIPTTPSDSAQIPTAPTPSNPSQPIGNNAAMVAVVVMAAIALAAGIFLFVRKQHS